MLYNYGQRPLTGTHSANIVFVLLKLLFVGWLIIAYARVVIKSEPNAVAMNWP